MTPAPGRHLMTPVSGTDCAFIEAAKTPRLLELLMSEVRSAPDLRGLENQYEIHGELRGNGSARQYIGKPRDDRAAEVAILESNRPEGGATSDLANFAADSQELAAPGHRAVVLVLDCLCSCSVSVAIFTVLCVGLSLAKQQNHDEHNPNTRKAQILADV